MVFTAYPGVNERALWPVVRAERLLAVPWAQGLISDLRGLGGLSAPQFEALYYELIKNFVELVQLLPSAYHARLGSLMAEGLVRAKLALQYYRDLNGTEAPDLLESYVIFSAALLAPLQKLTQTYTVTITNMTGRLLREWAPLLGPMPIAEEHYYRVRLGGGGRQVREAQELAPMLAFQLLPKVGLGWLAQDPRLFNDWLSLLKGAKQVVSSKLRCLWERLAVEHRSVLATLPLGTAPLKPLVLTTTAHGEDFLAWLHEGVAKQTLPVNGPTAAIHIIPHGVFLELPKLLRRFCQEAPNQREFDTVLGQLRHLGLFHATQPGEVPLKPYIYRAENRQEALWSLAEKLVTQEPTPADFRNNPASLPSMTAVEPDAELHKLVRYGVELFLPSLLGFVANFWGRIEANFLPLGVGPGPAPAKAGKLIRARLQQRRHEQLAQEFAEVLDAQTLRRAQVLQQAELEFRQWLSQLHKPLSV